MRWGGGGTPSIDEPNKAYPQPDIAEIEYEDEPIAYSEAIDWSTRYNDEIARRKDEDPSYVFSLSGSGIENDPYLIQDEYDFYYMRNKGNGSHFKLTNDIYLNYGKFIENEETGEVEYFSRKNQNDKVFQWEKMSFSNRVLDGNGHTIYGLYGENLFSSISSSIKNLNIKNSYCLLGAFLTNQASSSAIVDNVAVYGFHIGGDNNGASIGSICNIVRGKFSNCVNYSKSLKKGREEGGLFGNGQGTFINCHNYGDVKYGDLGTGGILGRNDSTYGNCTFICCVNHADLKSNGSYGRLGGIVGCVQKGATFEQCYNIGAISCQKSGQGGIVGFVDSNASVKITNCINKGDFTKYYVGNTGGIVGFSYGTTKIIACENYGSFYSYTVGGICGSIGSGEIVGCKNYGIVIGAQDSGGGIVASSGKALIQNCQNFADVSGTANLRCGGIVGYSSNSIITECTNEGNVTGVASSNHSQFFGGVVGYCKNSKVHICKNSGEVKCRGEIGGIVGKSENSAISDVINEGNVKNTYSFACAGIIGDFINSQLSNCLNSGDVISSGNLVGEIYAIKDGDCLIKQCISFSRVNEIERNVFYGPDFSGFYYDRKMGTIGLNAFEAVGLFQGRITEEYLLSRGYVKAG